MKNTLHTILKTTFIVIALVAFNQSNAQLLQWNTFGNLGTETTQASVFNNANISAASLTMGAGLAGATNSNRFGGTGWFTTGDTNPNTLAQAIATNDYIQFTVTPNAGYSFTATSFVFGWDHSGTGPGSLTLRSSADGYTTDLGSVTGLAASQTNGNTITISTLSNITTATTFRLYGYAATATGGTGGLDVASNAVNVVLNGTTVSAGIVTAQAGPWTTGSTWVGGIVPTSAQNVIINHAVSGTTGITRDSGTTTTINTAGSLNMSGATYTNNGTTTVFGTFSIGSGAWATGNNFIYSGTTSRLSFSATSNYIINNTDVYWPAANSPAYVDVSNSAGITINSPMVRTISNSINVGGAVNMPSGALTINVYCNINANGYFSAAPIYGPVSILNYQSGGNYGRGFEWSALGAGTINVTPGYPNDVIVSPATTLDYNNGTPNAKAMAGSLLVSGIFDMSVGGGASGGALTVAGNATINGTLKLGNTNGDDLKLGGNFTKSGTFNGNGRAVFFTKASGTQTLTLSGTTVFPYLVFDSSTGSRTVSASGNYTVSAPNGGIAITFGSASDVLDLSNNNTLIIGTAGVANTVSGSGTIKGGNFSALSLLGTGSIGTLNFTSGAQTLQTFTIDRTSGANAAVLGTPLTIVGSMTLTNGRFNVGNNPLYISGSATLTATSTNFVIADLANGTSAALRKTFTGPSSYTYPIGDMSGNYTPLAVTFPSTGGPSFSSAYADVAVKAVKHPNMDAPTDYIKRYWDFKTSGISYSTFTTQYTMAGTYVPGDVMGTEANCIGNTWVGSGWSESGAPVNTGTHTFSTTGIISSTNQPTAGYRGADIAINNPTPANQATGTTYVFGAQVAGSNTDATFTIYNYGEQTLTFSSAIVTSSTAGVFTFNPAFSTTPSIPVGGSRTFTIRFTPAAATSYLTGNYVTFVTNDPDESPYVINFTGSGVAPFKEINITGLGQSINPPNTTTFLDNTKYAATDVGSFLDHTFTIENQGNITLNVSGTSVGGTNPGDFTIITPPASTVAPQVGATPGTTTFVVRFAPTAAGVRAATITVNNDDTDESVYTFNVDGTGRDREIEVYGNGNSIVTGDLTPSTTDNTDFGNVNVTSGTQVKNFSIFNTGLLSLSVSSVTITGANASDFTITTSPATTVAAGAATTLGITFDPSATGTRTALVTIVNNDSNENPYTFAIQGNGLDYIPCALGSNQVIAFQDFEGSAGELGYTTALESGAATPVVTGGTAYGASRVTTSGLTPKFAGTQSFQAPGFSATSTTEKTTTIEFNTVDASAYQDVSMTFKLGAYSTNTTQGLDGNPEKCIVYLSKDNGATWSQEIDIAGNSNSIWDINSSTGSVTQSYDGNNITVAYASAATSTNTGPRAITLNNIPNLSQLKLRITFTLDRADELWVIDDVQFLGKKTATTTWNGSAWSNGAPTSSVKAIINGPYNTTSGSVDACACQINSAVTINSNQYFDIQDNFDNSGSLSVSNNGSLIQHNNAAVNTGSSVSITRTTAPYHKYDYTYWSSPVTNANVGTTFTGWRTDYAFQFATANFMDVLTAATGAAPADGYDDDGNAWLNISNGTTMTPAKGYAIMAPTSVVFSPTATATVTFSGPVNNGIITIPLAQSQNTANSSDDYNLIGNPYPSALSGDAFITQNAVTTAQISGTLYFWTHATPIAPIPGPSQYNFITADYAMYTLSGGTASATGSAQPTGKIASGEGFFVEAANGATQATFNNAMRDKTYSNSQFFRMASTATQPSGQKDRLWLNFTRDNGLFSQQLIAYFANTTLGYDPGYDGIVNMTQNSVSFYSFIGDDKSRIQARPAFDVSDVVPLGFSILAPGNYHISIDQTEGALADEATNVYLEDKLLNVIHNLKQSTYDFESEAGVFNDRFILRYTDSALGNPDYNAANNNVVVAVSGGQIKVKSYSKEIASIAVYDVLGREVYSKQNVASEEFTIDNAVRNQQALIVKVTLENGTVVNRKIIF